MTEKVTIGYNEWIITTFTHEQKILSVPYVSYFFLKRYNWNVNTHLELSRIFFCNFLSTIFFFDWRTQSASHWLRFKVSLVMVQTTLFMNFSSKKKNPLLRLYFKIIDDFLKNTWRDYHYKCSSKNLFYHPCISLSYNSQSESVSRWSLENELFWGNCLEVK